MTAAIRVRHLHHRYGRRVVLDDVSFEVGRGEIFGFLGANGAGKTTTIRVLATLLEPTAGRVEIEGIDVVLEPERVRRVLGFMPDHAGLYERTTVRQYLAFFADAFGVSRDVVDGVLELTDIAQLAERDVSALSKGQKQRLQLARILLHDPQVLVLDEPASDLDPRARAELRDLLVQLAGMGKTVLLSSHILTELAELCTSAAVLENGRIVAHGTLDEIARQGERAATTERATAGDEAPEAPTRRLRVHVLVRDDEAVQTALAGVPSAAIEPGPPAARGAYYWVTHEGDAQGSADVVRALVLAGVPVASVEPDRTELERAFLRLTSRADAPPETESAAPRRAGESR